MNASAKPVRPDGRESDKLRPIRMRKNPVCYAEGSVLIETGRTKLLCAATVEEAVPRWMREQKKTGGWISAEYSMAPYASPERKSRESRARASGRSTEIQRLVGRALRAVVDLEKLGPRTIWLDCDVLQADGGTRTAAITGSFIALTLALRKLRKNNLLADWPVQHHVAAVSVGLVGGQPRLDLCYQEDSIAEADLNVVMTEDGRFVEINGGGEAAPLSERQLEALLKLAQQGIKQLIAAQKKVLG